MTEQNTPSPDFSVENGSWKDSTSKAEGLRAAADFLEQDCIPAGTVVAIHDIPRRIVSRAEAEIVMVLLKNRAQLLRKMADDLERA